MTNCLECGDCFQVAVARGVGVFIDIADEPLGIRATGNKRRQVKALAGTTPTGREIDDDEGFKARRVTGGPGK